MDAQLAAVVGALRDPSTLAALSGSVRPIAQLLAATADLPVVGEAVKASVDAVGQLTAQALGVVEDAAGSALAAVVGEVAAQAVGSALAEIADAVPVLGTVVSVIQMVAGAESAVETTDQYFAAWAKDALAAFAWQPGTIDGDQGTSTPGAIFAPHSLQVDPSSLNIVGSSIVPTAGQLLAVLTEYQRAPAPVVLGWIAGAARVDLHDTGPGGPWAALYVSQATIAYAQLPAADVSQAHRRAFHALRRALAASRSAHARAIYWIVYMDLIAWQFDHGILTTPSMMASAISYTFDPAEGFQIAVQTSLGPAPPTSPLTFPYPRIDPATHAAVGLDSPGSSLGGGSAGPVPILTAPPMVGTVDVSTVVVDQRPLGALVAGVQSYQAAIAKLPRLTRAQVVAVYLHLHLGPRRHLKPPAFSAAARELDPTPPSLGPLASRSGSSTGAAGGVPFTHQQAASALVQAFADAGRPYNLRQALAVQTIARSESGGSYNGWGAAHNKGSIQCKSKPPCPAGCVEHLDHRGPGPTDGPYQWCYRSYATDALAWADLVRFLLPRFDDGTLSTGSPDQWAHSLHSRGYMGLGEDRVARAYRAGAEAIRAAVPAYQALQLDPFPAPAPAEAAPSSGLGLVLSVFGLGVAAVLASSRRK